MVMVVAGGRESVHSLAIQLIPLSLAIWPTQAYNEHVQMHTKCVFNKQIIHIHMQKIPFFRHHDHQHLYTLTSKFQFDKPLLRTP